MEDLYSPYETYQILKSNGADGVLDKYKNNYDKLKSSFLVRDESCGKYKVYCSVLDFLSQQSKSNSIFNTTGDNCYYYNEIVLEDCNQRFRIDIDAKNSLLDNINLTLIGYGNAPLNELLLVKNITVPCERWRKMWTIIYYLRDIFRRTMTAYLADSKHCDNKIMLKDITKSNFVILESCNAEKMSFHLISPNIAFCNAKSLAEFASLFYESVPHEFMPILDKSVYKANQSFRIAGSSKVGDSSRIMRYCETSNRLFGHEICKDEVLIYTLLNIDSIPESYMGKMRIFGQKEEITKKTPVPICINDELLNTVYGVINKKYPNTFVIRNVAEYKNIITFNRIRPAYCELCNRTHDKDNTLYVTIWNNNNYVNVYEHCYRQESCEKIKIYSEYNGDPEKLKPEELKTIETKAMVTKEEALKYVSTNFALLANKNIYSEPVMQDFEFVDTLVVQAQMGVGKSKALISHINKYYDDTSIIRVISFRKTFTEAMANRFENFDSYSDHKNTIGLDIKRLIIQVESLHRLSDASCDLLILDEIESIFNQFSSNCNKNVSTSFINFCKLLKNSKRVIIMDANLLNRTYNMIKALRPDHAIHYHKNEYEKAADDKYKFIRRDIIWYSMLYNMLYEGKKIVIPTNSISASKDIYKYILTHFPNIKDRVILYNSETSDSLKKAHFADVNSYWGNYDVIIYTPTLTAGVSYEIETFDVVFGYFTDISCDVETCRQMLGRVRNIKSREYYIYIRSHGIRYYHTNPDKIKRNIIARRIISVDTDILNNLLPCYNINLEDASYLGINQNYFESPIAQLTYENISVMNMSKNDYFKHFVNQVVATGASCEFVTELNTAEVGKERDTEGDKKELEEAKKIIEAPRINEIQYEHLKKKPELSLDEAEEAQISRYEFERSFDMHLLANVNLTLDVVVSCNKYRVKINYKHLKELGLCSTIPESIKLIQSFGKAKMDKAMANPDELQFKDMTNDSYSGFYHIICYKLLEYLGIELTIVNKDGCIERYSTELFDCIKINIDKFGALNRLVDLADERIGAKRIAITKLKDIVCREAVDDKNMVKAIGMVLVTVNPILNYTYGLKLVKERKKKDSKEIFSKFSLNITTPALEDKTLFPKVRQNLIQKLG
jgi:hypothetical protein